ncbi:MAG TPA: anti-sigma F factor [Desulfotomaculum sp.]|nr:anti-sigma F factor [Desulfotomaculum sp.]
MLNRFRLEFPSRPDNVGLARVTVAAFAAQIDPTLEELDDIKGAVSEAVANAIVHGYDNSPDGVVTVEGVLYGDAIEVFVEDSGKGMEDVGQAMEPEFSTDPERLGLGFSFMQTFMDSVSVDSVPGRGTRVVMRKQFARRH